MYPVVIRISKIHDLKAIHNYCVALAVCQYYMPHSSVLYFGERYTCLHLLSFLFSYAQAVKWVEAVMVHKVSELVVFQIATRRHVHFETAEDY